MKATVQATRIYTLVLTEEEAQALSRLSDYLQQSDLEAALRRGKMDEGETGFLFQLLGVIRGAVHEPSSSR